jgi:hypothetical protein
MTREHLFPLWLIRHAKVFKEGISWAGRSGINPKSATLPLCLSCNNRFGSELEGVVSGIFVRLEANEGITGSEAELLVRWLWKFYGLGACYFEAGNPYWRYSDRWTLIERVLGRPFEEVKGRLILSIGLIHANSSGYNDWPVGLDSPLGEMDTFFISGVFGRVALLTGLQKFVDLVPKFMGTHVFASENGSADDRFLPPICFPFSNDAINVMKEVSPRLKEVHERFARLHAPGLIRPERPRVIIEG